MAALVVDKRRKYICEINTIMHNESANKIFNAFINMGGLYQLVNCFIEAAERICI